MSEHPSAPDIAARLDLRKYPRSWRGKCPLCSYPGDVFSIRQKPGHRAVAFCSNGCTRAALEAELTRIISGYRTPAATDSNAASIAETREARKAKALRLWSGSDLTGHELYLTARCIGQFASSCALRFRADCGHPERRGRYPAMVALVRDAAGEPLGVHRTYLRTDRRGKADIEPTKASIGLISGGAVRLDPVAPELVIGEGIETSAAAGILMTLPAWAAINAGNLACGLVLPPEVRSVVIAADPDPPGERAARTAALRWSAEGRKVRIARPSVYGKDFNDLLMEKLNG